MSFPLLVATTELDTSNTCNTLSVSVRAEALCSGKARRSSLVMLLCCSLKLSLRVCYLMFPWPGLFSTEFHVLFSLNSLFAFLINTFYF